MLNDMPFSDRSIVSGEANRIFTVLLRSQVVKFIHEHCDKLDHEMEAGLEKLRDIYTIPANVTTISEIPKTTQRKEWNDEESEEVDEIQTECLTISLDTEQIVDESIRILGGVGQELFKLHPQEPLPENREYVIYWKPSESPETVIAMGANGNQSEVETLQTEEFDREKYEIISEQEALALIPEAMTEDRAFFQKIVESMRQIQDCVAVDWGGYHDDYIETIVTTYQTKDRLRTAAYDLEDYCDTRDLTYGNSLPPGEKRRVRKPVSRETTSADQPKKGRENRRSGSIIQ
jgi:hypothetical protein